MQFIFVNFPDKMCYHVRSHDEVRPRSWEKFRKDDILMVTNSILTNVDSFFNFLLPIIFAYKTFSGKENIGRLSVLLFIFFLNLGNGIRL